MYPFDLGNVARGINLGKIGAGMNRLKKERKKEKGFEVKMSKFARVGTG